MSTPPGPEHDVIAVDAAETVTIHSVDSFLALSEDQQKAAINGVPVDQLPRLIEAAERRMDGHRMMAPILLRHSAGLAQFGLAPWGGQARPINDLLANPHKPTEMQRIQQLLELLRDEQMKRDLQDPAKKMKVVGLALLLTLVAASAHKDTAPPDTGVPDKK